MPLLQKAALRLFFEDNQAHEKSTRRAQNPSRWRWRGGTERHTTLTGLSVRVHFHKPDCFKRASYHPINGRSLCSRKCWIRKRIEGCMSICSISSGEKKPTSNDSSLVFKDPLKDDRQNRQKIVDGPLRLRGLRRDEDSYKSQQCILAQYPIQFLLSFPSPQFARWFPLFPSPHRVRPIHEYRYAIGAVSFLPRSKQWLMQTGQGYLFLGRSDRSSNQHGSCIS